MTSHTRRRLFMYASFAVVLLLFYFGNVAIQTHLGKKALSKTGLTHYDLETALEMAKDQSKPVLADLSAIWCPSCRKLDNTIFANALVKKKLEESFIFARIEFESPEGKAFQKRYDAPGFPTLLVLNDKGDLVKKLDITFDPQAFLALLNDL